MTQVTVDNKPVSKGISDGSITVPSTEVWHVNILVGGNNTGDYTEVEINGYAVSRLDSGSEHVLEDVVLTGGDTVSLANGDLYITGYVVSQ